MSRARLRALRLVGFKSFADRTHVEFGPGISAVIGPNGSGKSNLADALRWTLGEQGRSLRTRRAEDLIFAGSSSRRAQGMADVTLVIDNEDRLLPVEFGEIELGRRLFRSGENEYLLNRQRIRLRDLVDLLDEANLADNAFLFIGQGMVDQALALRPEERRPLFEEAAGIRKHERRRRAAEAELAEAEANLERARDLLGELRPQAKRLAAQAEQQAQRRHAGVELAEALVALGRERLGGAEREAEAQAAALDRAHRDADEALAALRAAEETVQALTEGLAARESAARIARDALDDARARVLEGRLASSRLVGDTENLGRERERLASERTALLVRLDAAARDLALPPVEADDAADEAAHEAERRLADAIRSLAEAREAGRGDEQRLRRLRQDREARVAQAGRIRQRAAEATHRLAEGERAAAATSERADRSGTRRVLAAKAAAEAARAESTAERVLDAARDEVARLEASARDASARRDAARAEAASTRARATALDELLAMGRPEAALARIRAAGGRAIAVGLEVEPALRRAADGALGDALGGHVVTSIAVPAIADVGGVLVLAEGAPARPLRDREAALADARRSAVADAAARLGGGLLTGGLRRDPGGVVARLLAQVAWVPDLGRALELVASGVLGPGWRVATVAGEVVGADGIVRLASGGSVLERRAERRELDARIVAAEAAVSAAIAADADAEERLEEGRRALGAARTALDAARRARRVADETERVAAREAEAAAREAAWAVSQLERLRGAAAEAAAQREAVDLETRAWEHEAAVAEGDATAEVRAAIASLEAQVVALTRDRDRWVERLGAQRERLEADRDRRRRAELRQAMDAARLDEVDRELERVAGAEADVTGRREPVVAALASAAADESRALGELRAIEAQGTDERGRLVAAERAVNEARERLRAAETRARAAEVRMLELRVQGDAAREGLLVELAAIGPEGLAALHAEAGATPAAGAGATPVAPRPDRRPGRAADAAVAADGVTSEADDERTAALEGALEAALEAWRGGTAARPASAPPSPGRLGALRRRYHELGAGNPYAAEELAELSVRLEALETQRDDLEAAIRDTRQLIARLEGLIVEQFRTTFSALEDAFARRFRQLFDGGEAQLSLTEPEDLGATGVEITARPPGKKRQPLSMLSGGERALTAVALLLAMLEVRPVPFCVLDEVDAALDEANVGRFSSALRGLAETIQFIVITHNRGTIEAADALYGVTVGDDAVSHVISLRLAADRDRAWRDDGRQGRVEGQVADAGDRHPVARGGESGS